MLHKYSCVFWLPYLYVLVYLVVDCVWNVMAHAQKPDFVFRRNRRVHFNRRGRQLSRLLAAEVCASVLVMLYKSRSEVVWEYWLPTPYASFPFTSPSVRHRVSSHFNWTLHRCDLETSWMRRPSQWGLLLQKQTNYVIARSCQLQQIHSSSDIWTHDHEASREWNWQRKTVALRDKPVLVPLRPPKSPHGPVPVWTRSSAMTDRPLTAWTMARPTF